MTVRDSWLLGAYLLAVVGGAPAVGLALRVLIRAGDREAVRAFTQRGLRMGGMVIGGLERLLILTFVLLNEYSAIGLILAAKGIIRYGELKETPNQKVAEYVLIGTMLSMVWAVLVGLAFCRFAPVAR
jgi:hypothetical protein